MKLKDVKLKVTYVDEGPKEHKRAPIVGEFDLSYFEEEITDKLIDYLAYESEERCYSATCKIIGFCECCEFDEYRIKSIEVIVPTQIINNKGKVGSQINISDVDILNL